MEEIKHRYQHHVSNLNLAIESVRSGELSYQKASETYGIPNSTLFRRVKLAEETQNREELMFTRSAQNLNAHKNSMPSRKVVNFNVKDTDLLINLYARYYKTFELPFAKNLASSEREENFEKLTAEYNKGCKVARTSKQLKSKISLSMSEIRKFEKDYAKFRKGEAEEPKPMSESLEKLSIFKKLVDKARGNPPEADADQSESEGNSGETEENDDEVGDQASLIVDQKITEFINGEMNSTIDAVISELNGSSGSKRQSRKRCASNVSFHNLYGFYNGDDDADDLDEAQDVTYQPAAKLKAEPIKGAAANRANMVSVVNSSACLLRTDLEREEYKAVQLQQEYYKLKIAKLKRDRRDYDSEADVHREEVAMRSEKLALERERIALERKRIRQEMGNLF